MTLCQYFNSQFTLMQTLDFILRILAACVCGACIGAERTRRFKEAGVRTHIVVCCAAALMMIVSKYAFVDLTSEAGVMFNGTRGADPARIAAQVVSGISFLGAGVIFKNGSTVKGLTTAAGVWATAGIGLALGAGMYWIGIFVTALVSLLQILMHRFPLGTDSYTTGHFTFTVTDYAEFKRVLSFEIEENKIHILEMSVTKREGEKADYDMNLKFPRGVGVEDFRGFLDSREDVISYSAASV